MTERELLAELRDVGHYIEEFRRGGIRVLSNYNVLSTGFDAPSLRALYIARPVYSRRRQLIAVSQ